MNRDDTAAHRRYAFGTWVRVDNLDNGKRTQVRINDRGPFVRGRIVDLSRGAAREIGMLGAGTAKVRLTVIAPRPSASGTSAGCVVQVASFRDAARAHALVERLARQGQRAEARSAGEWWRVVLPAGTAVEARRLLEGTGAAFPGAAISCAGPAASR